MLSAADILPLLSLTASCWCLCMSQAQLAQTIQWIELPGAHLLEEQWTSSAPVNLQMEQEPSSWWQKAQASSIFHHRNLHFTTWYAQTLPAPPVRTLVSEKIRCSSYHLWCCTVWWPLFISHSAGDTYPQPIQLLQARRSSPAALASMRSARHACSPRTAELHPPSGAPVVWGLWCYWESDFNPCWGPCPVALYWGLICCSVQFLTSSVHLPVWNVTQTVASLGYLC